MRLLWFTEKDIYHPSAGESETINHELACRLVHNGHRVTFICARWKGSSLEEKIEGYRVIRIGRRWTLWWKARLYYKKYLKGKFDVVVDHVQTIPFFTKWYVTEKHVLFIPELIREIWFYEKHFPFSIMGYMFERWYLRRLRNKKVITLSESTKKDLLRLGFHPRNIFIMSVGIPIEPAKYLSENDTFKVPTMLAYGAVRPMKRTDHIVKAFFIAKKTLKDLELVISGDTGTNLHYRAMVRDEIELSPYKSSVKYLGKIDREKKIEIMKKCHVLCATSIKEGWGFTVMEANAEGTPAVVYNVDGLRDSVRHERTGLICRQNTPQELADTIIELFDDRERYNRMRRDAWHRSKEMTFDTSYKEFIKIMLTL